VSSGENKKVALLPFGSEMNGPMARRTNERRKREEEEEEDFVSGVL
jgi:hypothetical protein